MSPITSKKVNKLTLQNVRNNSSTLWFQLEDTVLLIGTLLLFDPVLFPMLMYLPSHRSRGYTYNGLIAIIVIY